MKNGENTSKNEFGLNKYTKFCRSFRTNNHFAIEVERRKNE